MSKNPVVLATVKSIKNKEYGIKNLAEIMTALLIIISTVISTIGLKLTWWKAITSPVKTYGILKIILYEIKIIYEKYNDAWLEIKDFKTNEIDDLMKEMIIGFEEIFK